MLHLLAMALCVIKHQNVIRVVSMETGTVIDTENIPNASFVPSELALTKFSSRNMKKLMSNAGYSIRGRQGKKATKDDMIRHLMQHWDTWVKDVATNKGVTHYFLGEQLMTVAGDPVVDVASADESSESIRVAIRENESGDDNDGSGDDDSDLQPASPVYPVFDGPIVLNIPDDEMMGEVIVKMSNNSGDYVHYKYYYTPHTKFQELYDALLLKADVQVGDEYDLRLRASNTPSMTVAYETISSWNENPMYLVIVVSGLSGGGKRAFGGGYGGSSKLTKDDKMKLLRDNLLMLSARVHGSQVSFVNDTWALVQQAHLDANQDPTVVMTNALLKLDVTVLKKMHSLTLGTTLDTKLCGLAKILFGGMWANIEDAKTQYAVTLEGMKDAVQLLALAQFSHGDTPVISWQMFADKILEIVAEKSAVADAGM